MTYSDQGDLYCIAISGVSNDNVRAMSVLTVVPHDNRPPPTVMIGPRNQTLRVKDTVVMKCEVKGEPQPAVTWYKVSVFVI